MLCTFLLARSTAQFYLRGEIKDRDKGPMSNIKILLQSNGYVYYSGSTGEFGITIAQRFDSVTIAAPGYETYAGLLDATKYQYITLIPLYTPPPSQPKNRLMSITKNLKPADWQGWTVGTETYSSLIESDFISAQNFPQTGFTMNINKASYSNVRRFLDMQSVVPPDAVRIEEMMNYFNFDYIAPAADSNFSFHSFLSECPWNSDNNLLYLHVCAKKANIDKIPPANLVFLIDISGSMDLPNRLPLLKSAFGLLVKNLRAEDTVSIVVYGSMVGVWMPPTSGANQNKILKAIDDLNPSGPTPGEAGIRAAYRLAKSSFIKGGNNRVILATDGDFNVGESSEEELENLVLAQRKSGIYLTCLGVGMGNYKDSKLEILAKRGNGNFAYIDGEKEAEKVLMQEFTQTIYAVADDAVMDVEFNPEVVDNYRLIGFDNKLQALYDTLNGLQGGEIGSGHSLLAMFEIHFASPPDAQGPNASLPGFARTCLHYKLPGDSNARQSLNACTQEVTAFSKLPDSYRFATSVAMFGELLKNSKFTQQLSWDDVIELASHSYDANEPSQKEFLDLVNQAKRIYAKEKKKKPKSPKS